MLNSKQNISEKTGLQPESEVHVGAVHKKQKPFSHIDYNEQIREEYQLPDAQKITRFLKNIWNRFPGIHVFAIGVIAARNRNIPAIRVG